MPLPLAAPSHLPAHPTPLSLLSQAANSPRLSFLSTGIDVSVLLSPCVSPSPPLSLCPQGCAFNMSCGFAKEHVSSVVRLISWKV